MQYEQNSPCAFYTYQSFEIFSIVFQIVKLVWVFPNAVWRYMPETDRRNWRYFTTPSSPAQTEAAEARGFGGRM